MSRIWRFIENHDPVIGLRSKHRFAILIGMTNIAAVVMSFSEPWSATEFVWVLWPASAIGIAAAVYYDSHLRCPTCSKAIWYNPVGIGQKRRWFWTPWVPGVCTRCAATVN